MRLGQTNRKKGTVRRYRGARTGILVWCSVSLSVISPCQLLVGVAGWVRVWTLDWEAALWLCFLRRMFGA
ncbi:hypothetical protein BP00DRAFT_76848 [Aspergillus indologenus CBS 114.80]|uniref:Uncharacterized protein n=1 Tax=Aspergillus indologenus CBS 114.80 TaxID=1450541 RepID=A0A2V5IC49_9EURO|nr:hypothetical protein BP00DRAFT_76848 [Aspergillus indologenus CBS 114.80]